MKQSLFDNPRSKRKKSGEEEPLENPFEFLNPPNDGGPHGPVDQSASKFDVIDKPISAFKRMSAARLKLLDKLGLKTIGDCLDNYPRSYLDRSDLLSICDAGRSNQVETIHGKVADKKDIPARSGQKFTKIYIYDGTDGAALVAFGKRAGYLKRSLKLGDSVAVSGKFKRSDWGIETTTFEYEKLTEEEADVIHTGRIVPVYQLTSGLQQRWMRSLMGEIAREYADAMPETIPLETRLKHSLVGRPRAALQIHLPDSHEELRQARRRIIFEEFYLLQLGLLLRKKQHETGRAGIKFRTDGEKARALLKNLPFQLTEAQRRALKEIKDDMRSPRPMNRLLQGDVGSGKTVVSAMAVAHAVDNGYQGVLMAPTEALAHQHYETMRGFLSPVGIQTVLLKGGMPAGERRTALNALETGYADLAVGTHALIEPDVKFARLGLAVVDEQHRFGVMQRARLTNKGKSPDILVMTATPIPRTLAMTAYGDLSHSVIDELPAGRLPVETRRFNETRVDFERVFNLLTEELKKGRQAYVVYPLVERSEEKEAKKESSEAKEDNRDAVAGHGRKSNRLPDSKGGMLPDRMSGAEKLEAKRDNRDAVAGHGRESNRLPDLNVEQLPDRMSGAEKLEAKRDNRDAVAGHGRESNRLPDSKGGMLPDRMSGAEKLEAKRDNRDAVAGHGRESNRLPDLNVEQLPDRMSGAEKLEAKEKSSESKRDIRDAVNGHRRLSNRLPDWNVGLLHGRMSGEEKLEAMEKFKSGETHVLVSTTVIEVGIDVPNASLMIIIHADRFGLSQLHQLRGRVGRGAHQSYCALVGWGKTEESQARLEAMVETTDGFEIAERDLEIRGPGEVLGTRQSGMPDLTMAHLTRDSEALKAARDAAAAFIDENPDLEGQSCDAVRAWLSRKWGGRLRLASVG